MKSVVINGVIKQRLYFELSPHNAYFYEKQEDLYATEDSNTCVSGSYVILNW